MGAVFIRTTRGRHNISFLLFLSENRKFWLFPAFTTKKDGKFYSCIEEPHVNVSETGMTKTLLFLNLRKYVNISSFDKIKVMFTYVKKTGWLYMSGICPHFN